MSIDLDAASRDVAALLEEFGQADAPFMVQVTAWRHRRGGDDVTMAIYVGLERAFRVEAATWGETLVKARARLVERFGAPA